MEFRPFRRPHANKAETILQALVRASQGAVVQNRSALLILKVLWASLAVLTLTRLSVGFEAALSNGLALTQAEYIAAIESPATQPPHVMVQAH
jgi:hypothetical protein